MARGVPSMSSNEMARPGGVDEEEVPSEEIVKGYEHEKGKFAGAERGGFRESVDRVHALDRDHGFRGASPINFKFSYKPYFLEPQEGGDKGYSLLHRALLGNRQDRHCE